MLEDSPNSPFPFGPNPGFPFEKGYPPAPPSPPPVPNR